MVTRIFVGGRAFWGDRLWGTRIFGVAFFLFEYFVFEYWLLFEELILLMGYLLMVTRIFVGGGTHLWVIICGGHAFLALRFSCLKICCLNVFCCLKSYFC